MKRFMAWLLGSALLLAASSSFAAGYNRFCFKWPYTWNDTNLGEYYLLVESVGGGASGEIRASYALARIYLGGTLIFDDYLDAMGCTPDLTGAAGTYTFKFTTALSWESRKFKIKEDQSQGSLYDWWSWSATFAAQTSGRRVTTKIASIADLTRVASAMTHVLIKQYDEIPTGTYRLYLDPCGTSGACYDPSLPGILLGSVDGESLARRKYVVLHEFGHYFQHKKFGDFLGNYAEDASEAACSCDHVEPEGHRSHCLQSRELIDAAQQEGFGHLYATRALNLYGSDPAFVYYKQFRLDDGTVLPPPVGVYFNSTSPAFAWMRNHSCTRAGTGIELDWLTFYYELHRWRSTTYSMEDFRSLYREACEVSGNPADCDEADGVEISWANTSAAAARAFGAGTARALDWANRGVTHGVNY